MIVYDIETGSLPEPTLRTIYREPTYEEFAESCDQRWKEETKRAKFEEGRTTAWEKFVDKAALSAHTGRVVAVGLLNPAKADPKILDASQDESATLGEFWRLYLQVRKSASAVLVGFNSSGFDLPFLIRRSWILGVDIPATVVVNRRYFDNVFLDLRDVWLLGQRWGDTPSSLDVVAKSLGVGSKADGNGAGGEVVSGKDFARLWEGTAEEKELARGYLNNDLKLTANVASRLGIV